MESVAICEIGGMKIKQRPEDFAVHEIDRFELGEGPFALYRLEKWDIGTIEAIRNVAKGWKISRRQISFGGLKDRHASCDQMISIRGGPPKNWDGSTFRLRYLGRSRDPIDRASFDGNAFRIVVRDLEEIPDPEPVRRWGVPNYFDDQRFGSLRGTEGEFIGRCLVRGELEKALRLALASPAAEDRKKHRAVKQLIRDRWGDWKTIHETLPNVPERSIVRYLMDHPTAYGRAFELMDDNLRILLVSAYQSHLWNRTLAEHLRPLADTYEIPYAAGTLRFYRALPDDRWFELSIPLLTPTSPSDEIARRILEEEGIEQRMLRLKSLDRTFFGKGIRFAIVRPVKFSAETGDDELNRGKKKLSLAFELPKGSYATIVLKRLFGSGDTPQGL